MWVRPLIVSPVHAPRRNQSRLRGVPEALSAARCHHSFPVLTVSGHHLFNIIVDEKKDIVRWFSTPSEVKCRPSSKKLSHGRCSHQMVTVGFLQRKKSTQPRVPPPGTSPFMVAPSGRAHAIKRVFLCLGLSPANVPHWRCAPSRVLEPHRGPRPGLQKPRGHHI